MNLQDKQQIDMIVKAQQKEEYFWVSKDGTKRNIEELDIEHAQRIIKLIMRQSGLTIASQEHFVFVPDNPVAWETIGNMAHALHMEVINQQYESPKDLPYFDDNLPY